MSYTIGINDEIWYRYKNRLHTLFCGPGNPCENFFEEHDLGPLDRMLIAQGILDAFSTDAGCPTETWSKLSKQFAKVPQVFQQDEHLFLELFQALRPRWRREDILFDIGLLVRKYYEQCHERIKTMRSHEHKRTKPQERRGAITSSPDELIAAIVRHSVDAQVREVLTLVGHSRDQAVQSYQSMEDATMDLVQLARMGTTEQRRFVTDKLKPLLNHDDWNVRRCVEFICDNAEPGKWPECPKCGSELARSVSSPLILLCPSCPYKEARKEVNE